MLAFEAAQGQTIFPDPRGWAVIAYVVIFPSLIGQVFYIRAVELIGANRAGWFINLLPVWGDLLAVTILVEEFHLYHAVALDRKSARLNSSHYCASRMQSSCRKTKTI